MSEEQIKVSDLVSFLRQIGKRDEFIVSVLESTIKTYMMYGGSLQEKINYEYHTAKRESLRSGKI